MLREVSGNYELPRYEFSLGLHFQNKIVYQTQEAMQKFLQLKRNFFPQKNLKSF